MDIWIVTIILIAALVLLITETIPIDLTALGIMVALMITRVLTPLETVKGFANPAVVTVAAMFLVSRAMIRAGAVGFVGEKIIEFSKGNSRLAMFLILVVVGTVSAFMNNTPVVVLFIPIILSISCEYDFSPSKFLIPMSYVSILGGTCTLIGTSTNIIVSDLSAIHGYGGLSMFELSKLGVPVAVLGVALIYSMAALLMPAHTPPVCELKDRPHRRYLGEFVILEKSPLVNKGSNDAFSDDYPSLEILEIIRGSQIYYPDRQGDRLAEGDLLLVKGSANDLVAVIQDKLVGLPYQAKELYGPKERGESLIVELIIPPQSAILGEDLLDTSLYRDPGIQIIGVKRRNLLYIEQKIQNLRLRIGDILLVRCLAEKVAEMREWTDVIIIEDVHHEIIHKKKAPQAFLIFLGLVIAAGTGLANIMVCALAAVFLMILTGCLQLRDAYRSLQGNVLILIAGTIALGAAMEKTGAARLYAEGFLSLFQGSNPRLVLLGLLVVTSIFTQILSNNAAAVLLFPIAVSAALSLGVNPKAFIVAVCFGASACFATPIGYQTNLLVYGPGGYRFSDYLKLGIPLNLLVILLGAALIPYFWRF